MMVFKAMSNVEDPAAIEASSPEYDIGRLLILSRLLTEDDRFMLKNADDVAALLDQDNAPDCEHASGPFIDFIETLRSDPPTYAGETPIEFIVMTIRQLSTCLRTPEHGGVWKFFHSADGGQEIREFLLPIDVIIEVLALWKVLGDNDLIGSDPSWLQAFGASALKVNSIANADMNLIPEDLRGPLMDIKNEWTPGDLTTIKEFFSVGTTNAAPVVLPFVPEALEEALKAMEGAGLPAQVVVESSGTVSADDSPAFMAARDLKDFISGYIASGPVKQAPRSS